MTNQCINYSAFERGHCYEPYIQNGNFTTTDPTYSMGTVVEFTCDPGHSLEQGPSIIECINIKDPYWNDTEPLCRGKSICCTQSSENTSISIYLLSIGWLLIHKGGYLIISSNYYVFISELLDRDLLAHTILPWVRIINMINKCNPNMYVKPCSWKT